MDSITNVHNSFIKAPWSDHPSRTPKEVVELAHIHYHIQLGTLVLKMLKDFGEDLEDQAERSAELHELRQMRTRQDRSEHETFSTEKAAERIHLRMGYLHV